VGYSIQSGVEKLPLSAPGLLVASSPEGHLDARAINALAPSLKVDIITTESAVSQYLFLLELSHCAPNGGSSGIRAGSTSIKFYPGTTVGHHRAPTNHLRAGFPLHDTFTLFPLSCHETKQLIMGHDSHRVALVMGVQRSMRAWVCKSDYCNLRHYKRRDGLIAEVCCQGPNTSTRRPCPGPR
jgi:hypothetical protein